MKKGNVMREFVSSSQVMENAIKEYKKSVGKVVLVAITPRTTIGTSCAFNPGRNRRSSRGL